MQLNFQGALTFESDEALQAGLSAAEQALTQNEASVLKLEDLQPLGLHVTVSMRTSATEQQYESSKQVLWAIVEEAYSGYIDIKSETYGTQRLHAKEIGRKEITIHDLTQN